MIPVFLTLGTLEQADKLLQASRGGSALNTAFIERFNATMPERLATLTRKCRHTAHRLEALALLPHSLMARLTRRRYIL